MTSLISLKNDTGVLGLNDLEAINDWLGETSVEPKSEKAEQASGLQALRNNYRSKTKTADVSQEAN